jgi:hypothetical protein
MIGSTWAQSDQPQTGRKRGLSRHSKNDARLFFLRARGFCQPKPHSVISVGIEIVPLVFLNVSTFLLLQKVIMRRPNWKAIRLKEEKKLNVRPLRKSSALLWVYCVFWGLHFEKKLMPQRFSESLKKKQKKKQRPKQRPFLKAQ